MLVLLVLLDENRVLVSDFVVLVRWAFVAHVTLQPMLTMRTVWFDTSGTEQLMLMMRTVWSDTSGWGG